MYDIKKQKLYTKEQKKDLLSSDFIEDTSQDFVLPEQDNKSELASVEDFKSSASSHVSKDKIKQGTKEAIEKYEAFESSEDSSEDYLDYVDYSEELETFDSLDDGQSPYEQDEVKQEVATKTKKSKKEDVPASCEAFDKGERLWDEFNHKEQEEIVKYYAPKIRFIALRMKGKLPKHIELNELISSGTVGLLEALKKFKPQLGIRFDSYAESRIRGAMIDELRRLDWFPRSLRTKAKDIKQAIWKLEHEIGRTPTTTELAEYTGLPEKEIESTLEAIDGQLCISLDSIQETMASVNNSGNEDNPFQSAAFTELVDKVAGLIDTLTPREKLVLSLYYNDELNMREASEVMEVTEGRVSQLHTQAINKLRKIFAEQYQDSL